MTTRRAFISSLLAAPVAAIALAHSAKTERSYVTLQDLGYLPPPHGQLCKRCEMTYEQSVVGHVMPIKDDPYKGHCRVWCTDGRSNVSWDYGQTYGQNPLRYDPVTDTQIPILDVQHDWRAKRVTWLEEVRS